MTHPAIIVLAGGTIAGGIYLGWRYLFGGDNETPLDPVDPVDPLDPVDPIPDPKPQPTPDEKAGICERTGKSYDAERFPDPQMVALLMVPLGYAVGPTLKTGSDKAEIKLFQKRAKVLKLPGAGSTHGEMSPCTLVSLGAARDLFDAGKWDFTKARG